MNKRAAAYLIKHGVRKLVNGAPELMLPLDRLQDFLNLLEPGDVAPGYEHIQRLYHVQATAVQSIQEQVVLYDRRTKSAPTEQNHGTSQRLTHEDE